MVIEFFLFPIKYFVKLGMSQTSKQMIQIGKTGLCNQNKETMIDLMVNLNNSKTSSYVKKKDLFVKN